MLELFERFAARHLGYRWPVAVALIAMLVVCLWVLVGATAALQDRWLIPAVLVTLWLLLLLSGLNLFSRVPGQAGPQASWWARVTASIHRGLYHLFAWFLLLVSVSLIVISFQLTSAWLRMN